jgi:2,4-dienoyl-CoA reductase-like NADH-dependent reductase (Old Yellow Enzyme family)
MSEQPTAPGEASGGFPHLLSPLRIGPLTIRNRIVSAGHDTTLPTDGTVNDALIAYHEARAAGGVGMLIVQVAGVHESARYTSHMLMAVSDDCIRGYRELAERCHHHGAVVIGQIFHPGREIMESQDGRAPVAYSASSVPTERFHVTPRPLDQRGIDEIVAGFAGAARRLIRADLDGVEVVASHGYLPAQFLNPRVNLREDAYGADPVRFLREALEAVRPAVQGRVVGLRISVDELSHDGLKPEEAIAAVRSVAAAGLVDYVHVTAGSSASLAGSVHIVPPMSIENAYTVPLAERVRAAVEVPVIVAGRINEPQQAERVLAAGGADACAMTRALISDPELPRKVSAGRAESIRACVGCNQACIGHFHAGYPISCIQYPETGRELQYGRLAAAADRCRVLIAGGGPAGLKAAATAAARGHQVVLHEAHTRVGGQVLLAERLPDRAEFGGVAINLLRDAQDAGARVVLRSTVDRALVERERPDVVVLATGGVPRQPPLEIQGTPNILDAWDVLQGARLPSGHIVIADWPCDWVGAGLSIHCARAGRRVTLAVNGYMPGQRIQQYLRDLLLADLHRLHVTVIPTVRLFGADDDTVYLQHTTSGEPVLVEDVSCLVLAQGQAAHDPLGPELEDLGARLVRIGDCLVPRSVEEAVLDGLEAGCSI